MLKAGVQEFEDYPLVINLSVFHSLTRSFTFTSTLMLPPAAMRFRSTSDDWRRSRSEYAGHRGVTSITLTEKKAPRCKFKSADSSLGRETSIGMNINDDIID